MGTSGAFGGSDTKPWKKMRKQLDDLLELDPPDRKPDENKTDPDGEEPTALDVLVSDIAQALIADDPRIRPGRPISNSSPSSAITALLGTLNTGGRGGGGRGGGAVSSGATTGRRDLGAGARRAGRAVYAGIAAGRGDAAGLAAAGLTFAQLAGRPWMDQVLAIADTVIGSSANADEHALRAAVVEVLLDLEGIADAANEGEVIRDVIAAYVVELAVVELAAALTARELTEEAAATVEDDVRNYVEARSDAIAVPSGAVQTVADFEDAAEMLMQEVLLILRAGGAS